MFSWQNIYPIKGERDKLKRYCFCYKNIKFVCSSHRVISSIYRAANNCRSSDNGRPKFANVRQNRNLGRTFCLANFLLQHLTISFTNKFDFLIRYSSKCTFVFMSVQIFLLSDQNGALVRHMSFQGKKIICSPDIYTALRVTFITQ